MEKMFYEERTGRYTKTLAAAKAQDKFPYVYRVWMDGDTVIGKAVVYAYGDSVSTIKGADDYIAEHIKEGQL